MKRKLLLIAFLVLISCLSQGVTRDKFRPESKIFKVKSGINKWLKEQNEKILRIDNLSPETLKSLAGKVADSNNVKKNSRSLKSEIPKEINEKAEETQI